MFLLLECFLHFMLLKLVFPDLPELEILARRPDQELLMEAGMHLIGDLMISPSSPQHNQLFFTCRRPLMIIRQTPYGSFGVVNHPRISPRLRNQVLMLTHSRILLQRFFGANYQNFRKIGHPVRRMFAVTINHCLNMMLNPEIRAPSQYLAQRGRGLEMLFTLNSQPMQWLATLPPFESLDRSWDQQPYSEYMTYTAFLNLRCLVFDFLSRNAAHRMSNDIEMSLLILWAALNNLLRDDADTGKFDLQARSCVSENRSAIDVLRSATPQTIMSIATRYNGTLLRRAISWFLSEKELHNKEKLQRDARAIVLELTECAMHFVDQRIPQGAPPAKPFDAPMPYD